MAANSTLVVYTYASCDTCRRAVKWLRAHGIEFVEKPIRETPPSRAEVRAMLAHLGGAGALRTLFNTAGRDYRELKLGERLPSLTEADAITLLAGNGNLVKRPFALGTITSTSTSTNTSTSVATGVGLVGFNEEAWAAALT